jgi:hypothetical protein
MTEEVEADMLRVPAPVLAMHDPGLLGVKFET